MLYLQRDAPAGLVDLAWTWFGAKASVVRCPNFGLCKQTCQTICGENSTTCSACVLNKEMDTITLKRLPVWWDAFGVEQCQAIAGHTDAKARRQWVSKWCDDYAYGRPDITWHYQTVIDAGMHDGTDTLYWLLRGFRVVAVDAVVSQRAVHRPLIQMARQQNMLTFVNKAISSTDASQITFYVHRQNWQLSTLSPPASKVHEFKQHVVDTTTCASLMRQFSVPLYLKVDIEGSDAACVKSLVQTSLRPLYISTEDPLLIDTLEELGYRNFKMVPQGVHRTHSQFSGGWTEDIPIAWTNASSVRSHRFFHRLHMHESWSTGSRERREHDLHARLW